MNRRVVITGIGVRAPGGGTTKAFWDLLTAGRTATRAITLFDPTGFRSRIAAECDFDPAAEGLTPQETRRMDRSAQCAVACTREALHDAGIVAGDIEPGRVGVSIGSAVGATMSLEDEYIAASDGGRTGWLVSPDYAVPHLYDYFVPGSLVAGQRWAVDHEPSGRPAGR